METERGHFDARGLCIRDHKCECCVRSINRGCVVTELCDACLNEECPEGKCSL